MIWFAGGSFFWLILSIIGLVDVFRNRHRMETWQVIVWAILIVLVPIVGLIAYLFWRISRSDALTDAMDYGDRYGGEGGVRDRKAQY
jgi:hypothetical protein